MHNIGVYGKATLGQNNWAGYFAEGDVKIENKLVLNKVVGQTDNTYGSLLQEEQTAKYYVSSTPGELGELHLHKVQTHHGVHLLMEVYRSSGSGIGHLKSIISLDVSEMVV